MSIQMNLFEDLVYREDSSRLAEKVLEITEEIDLITRVYPEDQTINVPVKEVEFMSVISYSGGKLRERRDSIVKEYETSGNIDCDKLRWCG